MQVKFPSVDCIFFFYQFLSRDKDLWHLNCFLTVCLSSLCFEFPVPTENVATIADCASVIEGVSRSRNALLNGDTKNYDWDSGYTCHQLGSGAIVVQLAQPYMIGSIR